MPILAAFMVPHPPMIIPEIGRGTEIQIEETTYAYQRVAREVAALQPETIIISSPHSIMYSDYFHISPGKRAHGSFAAYKAKEIAFEEQYDTALIEQICLSADKKGLAAGLLGERNPELDHGTMIPLYFIEKEYSGFNIVRIGLSGLPLTEHYKLGMAIQDAVEKTGRRTVYIASGDLSHKLKTYGPYGYAPEGPEYDNKIMECSGRAAFGEYLEFEETFCDKAAECGHRSFVIMAGAFDGWNVKAEKLSYQDVTGVGYGICSFYPTGRDEKRHFLDQYLINQSTTLKERRDQEDEFVRLARTSVENYVLKHKKIIIPDWVSDELRDTKAGVFVSIHEHGRLRGCIGTILPAKDCIAEEIIGNGISACSRDPRFSPVQKEELAYLEISVDVLMPPERIDGPECLDVKKYGVIVSNGSRRGLLLPDLDGVNTVEEQIEIARKKAGISREEQVSLERFEVIRHY